MNKQKLTQLAMELAALSEERRETEKREEKIKNLLKETFGETEIDLGDLLIKIQERSRTSIDREKLQEDLGAKAKKYEKTTIYLAVEIKKK